MSGICKNIEEYKKYIQEHRIFLSEPLIKKFLQETENKKLLLKAVCFPNSKNKIELENVFREFYADIRLYSYISTVIYRHAICFDKRQRRQNSRYPLILDQPIPNHDSLITIINNINYKMTLDQAVLTENKFQFEDTIENSNLFYAIKKLTPLQRSIIKMAYVHELTDKSISQKLGTTRQAVTKTRNKALDNIKTYLDNKGVLVS
jgi:RNA polymerase sigma factor (sigma-70 family)